ncbi:MAG: branched-chain amino acid ABC transporter permease [Trueperaceae bacterium]
MQKERDSRPVLARLTPWLIGAAVLIALFARIAFLISERGYTAAFFAGALLQSLQLGSLYALIALGYTMVYGIIRLINFAHGEVFMVGAFVSYFIFARTPYALPWALFAAALSTFGLMYVVSLWRGRLGDPLVLGTGIISFIALTLILSSSALGWIPALVLSMLITGVVGVLLDRVAYRPLRGAPRISLLITAIAMSFFLQNTGVLAFTRNVTAYRPETSWTQSMQFELVGQTVFGTRVVILVVLLTAALVVVLTMFVTRTRLGKAMRASAQDPEVAQMMGIDVNRVIATTFLLGSMLAAAAGVLWGMSYGTLSQPAVMGLLPGIKAFAAAVVGGIGSLPGAVIGGVLLGFMENFFTALIPGVTQYKDTFAFALLIIVLLIKPSGIVGEDLSEKV